VVVVDPRCDPRCDEVAVTSCSSAVMHSMHVVPTLADALADCAGAAALCPAWCCGAQRIAANAAARCCNNDGLLFFQ
jgi:tRNA C32,U32 (ribose-2'-O)-methylase TrmJ